MKDCNNATSNRQYCDKHASAADRRKMSGNKQAKILSGCCNAKCKTGKVHEMGEQYCTKCKEPCCWKSK